MSIYFCKIAETFEIFCKDIEIFTGEKCVFNFLLIYTLFAVFCGFKFKYINICLIYLISWIKKS